MPERWQAPLVEIAGTPMTDGLLEEARRGPRHPMPGPSNATRIVVAVVALAIAAAAGAFLLRAFEGQDPVPMGRTYTDDDGGLGWTISVPEGWSVLERPMPDESQEGVFGDFGTIWLVNAAAAGLDREAIAVVDEFQAQLPVDGVVVAINPILSAVARNGRDDFGLPPTLGEPSYEGPDALATWQANGVGYEALAWYGPETPDADLQASREAVSSMIFPSLPDVAAGTFEVYTMFTRNLGSEGGFPAGSVVEVEDTSRAGAFNGAYVVTDADGQRWAFPTEDLFRTCGVRWDGEGFVCRDGTRYTREGRPVDGEGQPLTPMTVIRTWNGYLLLDIESGIEP